MFLLHIQAEMVPTGSPPTNKCPVCYIQDVSLTHPGSNGAYGELSQTHAHHNIYWTFLLHIQAEIVHTLNHSRKPMPSMLFENMFLLHIYAELVPTETHATNLYPVCSVKDLSLKIKAEMMPIGNSFHKPTPGTLPTECFLYISKAKIGLTGNFTVPPTNRSQYALSGMSPLHTQAEIMPT